MQTFSSCSEQGLLLAVVCGLLAAVVSLIVERSLSNQWKPWVTDVQALVIVACGLSSCGWWALELRLSNCGTRAQLLCAIWNHPGPGMGPVSPALEGGFVSTVPPGMS